MVARNSSAEVCSVQMRGMEGTHCLHRPLSLERVPTDTSIRVRDARNGCGSGTPRKQSIAMLASMATFCPSNARTTSSVSDSRLESLEEMESSAESGGSFNSLTTSDGNSVTAYDEAHFGRTPSGVKMVSCEAAAKEDQEGLGLKEGRCISDNEDENSWKEQEAFDTDESETSNRKIPRKRESGGTTWTDDKHSSYLNSIEDTFVRSLYQQEYCASDACEKLGPNERDSAESRLADAYACCTSNPVELFELLQCGSYQQKAYYRPQTLETAFSSSPSLVASPWIQHFKPKMAISTTLGGLMSPTVPGNVVGNVEEPCSVMAPSQQINVGDRNRKEWMDGREERLIRVDVESSESEDPEQKGVESGGEAPERDWVRRVWQKRLQSNGKLLVGAVLKKDTSMSAQKRSVEFELGNADVFLAKRNKVTQQELAWRDLKMLKQYVAEERVQAEVAQAIISPKIEPTQQVLMHYQDTLLMEDLMVESKCNRASALGSLKSFPDKDQQRLAGRSVLDQVVSRLGKAPCKDVRGCSAVPEINHVSHLKDSNVSSCTTSQAPTPLLFIKSGLEIQREKLSQVEEAFSSAAAATTKCLREDGCDSPLPAGNSLHGHQQRDEQDGPHGFTHTAPTLGRSSLLGKHNLGLEAEEDAPAINAQVKGEIKVEKAEEWKPEPPFSSSRAKTWTWGVRGMRHRLHKPPLPPQPPRDVNPSGEAEAQKQFCMR